ncbi:MAG: histidine kinase [Frankiales bacterium]|nr:histidine kinase [Frankiales bacterium]
MTVPVARGPEEVRAVPDDVVTAPPDALADAEREWRARRWRYAVPFAGVWLVVLLGPAGDVVDRSGSPVGTVVGLGLLVAFAVLYLVLVVLAWDRSPAGRRRAGALAVVLLALALAVLPFAGPSGLTTFIFVAVVVQLVLPWRWAILATVALVALEALVSRAAGWPDWGSYAFSIVAAGMAMFGVARMAERNRALVEAHEERAAYAVLAERERFARDLHDILGHSLTVIAVKSELAGKLVGLDPERARREVEDIERLARVALADVRATVGNYREVSLAAELASARSALEAAGVDPDLPSAVDAVPGDLRELFAYVVREGVTNVVRHSGAGTCTVRLGPASVEVLDDGRGGGPTHDGHGLAGLRSRAAAAGAVIEAGPLPTGGFRLAAHRGAAS